MTGKLKLHDPSLLPGANGLLASLCPPPPRPASPCRGAGLTQPVQRPISGHARVQGTTGSSGKVKIPLAHFAALEPLMNRFQGPGGFASSTQL